MADLDFDSPAVQDFIALLARNKTVVDPTLTTFDFLRQRAGEMSQAYAAVAPHMPPDIQRGLRSAEMKIPDDATAERYNRSYAKMIEFVGRMHRAGVPIVPGTDAIPGFTLQRELELYVQAGMTPGEALQSATWTSAKVARVLDDRGSIEVGKRADLVITHSNPLDKIENTIDTAYVMVNGRLYDANTLNEIGLRERKRARFEFEPR